METPLKISFQGFVNFYLVLQFFIFHTDHLGLLLIFLFFLIIHVKQDAVYTGKNNDKTYNQQFAVASGFR